MATWSGAPYSSTLLCSSSSSSSLSSPPRLPHLPHRFSGVLSAADHFQGVKATRSTYEKGQARPPLFQICRAAEYKFPDPIPEFATAETEKFRNHLLKRLSKKKDIFGDSIEEVVGICTEIFGRFLHSEYGGPGTLLVIPFIDMADTVNERGLPGGPQAARAAVNWAQQHVDNDWKDWTTGTD